MSGDRKFFITELSIRIFAEDAPWDGNLDWLSHDATHDEYAAEVLDQQDSEVPVALFTAMALESGIDPGFFGLTDAGEAK